MPAPATQDVAASLRVSIGMLVRRLRQVHDEGDLTLAESSALARLERAGPTTSAALARREQIRPQSMGATLAGLQERGLVTRAPDPRDGRRVNLSVTDAGRRLVSSRRSAKVEPLAHTLANEFSAAELIVLADAASLLERLAEHL